MGPINMSHCFPLQLTACHKFIITLLPLLANLGAATFVETHWPERERLRGLQGVGLLYRSHIDKNKPEQPWVQLQLIPRWGETTDMPTPLF